jgi:hypothetical protein
VGTSTRAGGEERGGVRPDRQGLERCGGTRAEPGHRGNGMHAAQAAVRTSGSRVWGPGAGFRRGKGAKPRRG